MEKQYYHRNTEPLNEKKTNRNWFALVLFISCFALIKPLMADYVVTGPIRGNECSGFVVEVCSSRSVDAVKGDDGSLYTVQRRYETVSEYKENAGRCWIDVKSRGSGLLSMALNLFTGTEFFEKQKDGTYERIDIEYLVFECKKVAY